MSTPSATEVLRTCTAAALKMAQYNKLKDKLEKLSGLNWTYRLVSEKDAEFTCTSTGVTIDTIYRRYTPSDREYLSIGYGNGDKKYYLQKDGDFKYMEMIEPLLDSYKKHKIRKEKNDAENLLEEKNMQALSDIFEAYDTTDKQSRYQSERLFASRLHEDQYSFSAKLDFMSISGEKVREIMPLLAQLGVVSLKSPGGV